MKPRHERVDFEDRSTRVGFEGAVTDFGRRGSMTKDMAKHHNTERKRWLHICSAVLLAVVVIVGATTAWLHSTRQSSEKTVNEMAEFYLGEIAERNSGAIIFELEKWMQQLQRIVLQVTPEKGIRFSHSPRGCPGCPETG